MDVGKKKPHFTTGFRSFSVRVVSHAFSQLDRDPVCRKHVVLDRSDVISPTSRNQGLRRFSSNRFSAQSKKSISDIAIFRQLTFPTATASLSYGYQITRNGTLLFSSPVGVVTVT